MPLDAGGFTEKDLATPASAGRSALRPICIQLADEGDVGAALRAARERLGLAAEDIALATRIRTAHVNALEAFDLAALPARPFVIGYVRAYARALGLETEAVVDRFRREAPVVDDRLRPPSGLLGAAGGRRIGVAAVLAMALLGAVIGWNVLRHAAVAPRHVAHQARHAPVARLDPGPVQLGAPLPAPPEAASPPTYATPGLAEPAAEPADPPGAPFVAAGAVYGAAPGDGHLVLQARKATVLVVRGPAGGVVFARQMAAGEAWRAPDDVAGLSADVGGAASMRTYIDGLSGADLAPGHTPLAPLLDHRPTPPIVPRGSS